MSLFNYEVGQKYPGATPSDDGCIIEMDASGLLLIVKFANPTANEIKQISADNPFEIRFVALNEVIFFTVKFGDLAWMDMPYSPHLSKVNWTPVEDKISGYALTVVLIDARSGIIKAIRLIGLGNQFSKNLFIEVNNLSEKQFNISKYSANLSSIMNRYSIKQIADLSAYKNRYKIK